MTLHFNLKAMFLVCIGLMFWHALLPASLSVAVLGGVAVCLFYARKKVLSVYDVIFSVSFLINLWYVLASWGNVRQYDYFNFYMQTDYFLEHDFFVAHPREYLSSVYFQPPLWSGIAAGVCKIMMLLGKTEEQGFDFVRFISLFAVSGAAIVFFRLLQRFAFEKKVGIFVFALFFFMPIHSIMANLVNNDALVYFLMIGALYLGILWYDGNSWRRAAQLSTIIFLAGMTKFSGLMIVAAIAVLGIGKLLQVQKKQRFLVLMQGMFIVCGTLLGFAWGIFLLYHHLPLVPPPLGIGYQDLSHYGLWERILVWNMWKMPFADVQAGVLEPNVWGALLKTSLFGEWSWQGMFWAYLLYALNGILTLVLVVSFFSLFKEKLGQNYIFNAACIVLSFAVFGAWINFWLDYPYFCSSEFRYVVILLPVSLCWFALYLSKKSPSKQTEFILAGCLGVFVLARIMLYLNTI